MTTAVASAPKSPTLRKGVVVLDAKPGDPVPTTMTAHAVEITPALAADWLARYADPKKRRIRKKVERYAATMKAGRWLDQSSKTMDFTSNGGVELSDGHHRLTAIVESGVTIWFEVHFGSDPRERRIEGIRINRTVADGLAMEGCTQYQSNIGAAIKIVLLYEKTGGTNERWIGSTNPLLPDVEEIIDSWLGEQAVWDALGKDLVRIARAMPDGASQQAVLAAGLLIERDHPGMAVPFLDSVADGRADPLDGKGVGAAKVIDRIIRSGATKASGGGSREEWSRYVLTILIRSFNASRAAGKWQRPELTGAKPFTLDKVK